MKKNTQTSKGKHMTINVAIEITMSTKMLAPKQKAWGIHLKQNDNNSSNNEYNKNNNDDDKIIL